VPGTAITVRSEEVLLHRLNNRYFLVSALKCFENVNDYTSLLGKREQKEGELANYYRHSNFCSVILPEEGLLLKK
jgi:hypothetical protein